MILLRQILIIITISSLGEFISDFFSLSVPGNVVGMIILLISLMSGILKLEMIDKVSDFLLTHLAFFFIPAGVNLISSLDVMQGQFIPILAVFSISTTLVIASTGTTIQALRRFSNRKIKNHSFDILSNDETEANQGRQDL
ncbi:CidA/LrgA family protein [Natroniella sp. ANB-PHB2]|uniref:CidA/LrgA family protein n=1 Tax=Natroniella sp. ANB-PHB2 TaxID=3384444 RepID=UPI0038D4B5A4